MVLPADIEMLTARASGGDAGAQYALAATLQRSGRRDDAERWLQTAAAAGHADALYTLATRKLNSLDGAAEAVAELRTAAASGSSPAGRQLSVLAALGIGVEKDDVGALTGLITLAKEGDPPALREIACLLALADVDHPEIDALLAAPRDPVGAAFAAARAGAGRGPSSAVVEDSLALLARARYPRTDILRSAARSASAADPAPIDWARAQSALSPTAGSLPDPRRLCESPDIVLFPAAVAPEVCEYAIAHAASRLGPSLTYDPIKGGMMRDPLRTSATACLSLIDLDLAIIALNRLIARAAALPDDQGEFLSVLRYAPGQQYRPHFDCIPAGPDLDRSGQRIKTALLFLNEEYEGGETHFLAPDLKVRGKRGDLLVFSNVDAAGAPDSSSRHAGLAVASGEKWLGSRWFRSKKFRF